MTPQKPQKLILKKSLEIKTRLSKIYIKIRNQLFRKIWENKEKMAY